MPAAAYPTHEECCERYRRCDELADRLSELHAHITAATCRFLELLAEFDENEYYVTAGFHSTANWLNWRCGIGMNAAREKVRVARALQGLPKIRRAFARGEISYSKVRAITRAADTQNEDYLLMFARHGTAYHVERLIAGFRRVKRIEAAEQDDPEDRAPQYRGVSSYWDEDGCLVVTARMPAEQGAMFLKAVELAVDRGFEAERNEAEESPDSSKPRPRIGQRRCDALAEMAETYLACEAPGGSSGDRYQVMLHVSAETSSAEPLDFPRIDKGPGVSAETSRRLSCDASIIPIVRDMKGEPLSIGRKSRTIPPAIMRALWVRDGGCRFPGCTNSRFVDGHHIKHWADGGETSLENLVLLCRRHHRLVHEGGYSCERTSRGIAFRSPRGNVIPDVFRLEAPASVNEPTAWIAGQVDCNHIDSMTCVTHYDGMGCDWGLAVGMLVDP